MRKLLAALFALLPVSAIANPACRGGDKKAGFASETRRNRCDLERGPHTKCVGTHNPSGGYQNKQTLSKTYY